MEKVFEKDYNHIRSGGTGFYEQKGGLIAVWGKEAVQFLDGLISNDVKTLDDGSQMLAAFPNAQGRLLAMVRVLSLGDRFLLETEEATREKVFNNLFRFTYAGDFFVEDLSDQYSFFEVFGHETGAAPSSVLKLRGAGRVTWVVPTEEVIGFFRSITDRELLEISDELYEVLRIESGIPKYGVDMDETTIVPELGIDGLISYKKGCYIGQEIIARIHFRGHVAKQLTGLVVSSPPFKGGVAAPMPSIGTDGVVGAATGILPGAELKTADGKNAGRATSAAFSPKLNKTVALAYVRYDYLGDGTDLKVGNSSVKVKNLPFILDKTKLQ